MPRWGSHEVRNNKIHCYLGCYGNNLLFHVTTVQQSGSLVAMDGNHVDGCMVFNQRAYIM
jgi:hypothetical protein